MSSGKKNYFRHSVNSFENPKIQKIIDLLGYEGYAYFYILIEVLAKRCENEFINPITIHQQSLRNVWRKQAKSTVKVVKKLQESGIFVATFRESFIDFDIPNLAKYLGKYTNKIAPNVPNKRKEKERKEKEIKINKIKINKKFNFEIVCENFPNNKSKSAGINSCIKRIKTENDFCLFEKSVINYAQHVKVKDKEIRYVKQLNNFIKDDYWIYWANPDPEELMPDLSKSAKGQNQMLEMLNEYENQGVL